MSDYRCTPYCTPFEEVDKKKADLLYEIRKTHPRARNIYRIVSVRNTDEHRAFFQVYNNKCCYCGCSITVLSAQLFEIDHIKPQAVAAEPRENVNDLNNLALACRACNGGKLDYWFKEMSNEWNPDSSGITWLFFRDDLYNIRIADGYLSNPKVTKLYEYLKLGAQFRRLDYLLMAMYGYMKTLPQGSEKSAALLNFYHALLKKRNYIGV